MRLGQFCHRFAIATNEDYLAFLLYSSEQFGKARFRFVSIHQYHKLS